MLASMTGETRFGLAAPSLQSFRREPAFWVSPIFRVPGAVASPSRSCRDTNSGPDLLSGLISPKDLTGRPKGI